MFLVVCVCVIFKGNKNKKVARLDGLCCVSWKSKGTESALPNAVCIIAVWNNSLYVGYIYSQRAQYH